MAPGDALKTGSDGRIGVTLKDDTRISLGPNTECCRAAFAGQTLRVADKNAAHD